MLLFSYLVTISPHQSISFMRKHLSLCIPCSTSKTLPSAWQRVGSQQITMRLMKWYYHIQMCNCHLMSTYTTRIMLESALQLLYLLPTKCQGEYFHYSVRTHSEFIQQLVVYFNLSAPPEKRLQVTFDSFSNSLSHSLSAHAHTSSHTHTLHPWKQRESAAPNGMCGRDRITTQNLNFTHQNNLKCFKMLMRYFCQVCQYDKITKMGIFSWSLKSVSPYTLPTF